MSNDVTGVPVEARIGPVCTKSGKRHLLTALCLGASVVFTTALAGEPGAAAAQTASSSPLREYLSKKQVALAAQGKHASIPETLKASVTAESRSGVRRLRIRDFQFLSDSDRDYAGYNLGAGSWDTGVAVLASAVADEYIIQAAAKKIPIDALDVVFTSHSDNAAVEKTHRVPYPRNLRYIAYIDSPASDTELEELRRTVESVSPALNLIVEAQPIAHGELFLTPSPAERDPALPPGLRDFLVEKRTAVLRRQEQAAKGSGEGYALKAHAAVEPVTGLRSTRTGAGNFQILHDSRKELVGYGLAPLAEEHLLGVMGTCLTHIFEIQAASRQVVLDSLEVRVQGTLTPRVGAGIKNPPRYKDVKYSVHIESPAPQSEILGLRDAVEASCPVYNLLKDPQTVQGRIVRDRYPG